MDLRTPLARQHHEQASELIGMHHAKAALVHHLSPAGLAAFDKLLDEKREKVRLLEEQRQALLAA